ncbi:ThiF family adenylyltransferase [Flavimobilis sp. GY10621]|uniref:ThiF family adenylyltransferase n=1 Tax=Flavimobilis rhizosphaerae TaxID=2775421 RepID=A0ABR9DQM2_9MICO|nr:ThiF family adenylyltransferase [Flavimobilis rhizosphaerae]MBD9699424.1 ThiF family adenylyltransferase [Flavimobilis rhizosphaerae]
MTSVRTPAAPGAVRAPGPRRLGPLVEPGPPLTGAQAARYARQLALPEVGTDGQRRLLAARVLVVGAGGLGSPTLLYLAAAGVGTLGIVDDDVVDVSNLQRQVLHTTADVGRRKVDSAADAVRALNPDVTVVMHDVRLEPSNVLSVLAGYDLVVDGSDNFATRYLVGDACAELGLPCVWGAVLGGHGQVSTFWAAPPGGSGVEYRDVFETPPPPGSVSSCSTAGVLGAVCAAVGSMLSLEVVRLVCGGPSLLGRLLVHDAWGATWREVPVAGTPGGRPLGRDLVAAVEACGVPSGAAAGADVIDVDALADLLADGTCDVVDVRSTEEFAAYGVPGTRSVPLEAFEDASAFDGPDAVRSPLVVLCELDARALRAAILAREAGLADVRAVAGGVVAWHATGRAISHVA